MVAVGLLGLMRRAGPEASETSTAVVVVTALTERWARPAEPATALPGAVVGEVSTEPTPLKMEAMAGFHQETRASRRREALEV